jgi:hypothetical protein
MDRKLHVDTLILIPTFKIYVFSYSRQTDKQTDGRRHTLAARGLEELFFQLCCCVSFWFWWEIGSDLEYPTCPQKAF